MNRISFQLVSCLLGSVALTIASNPLSARADAPIPNSSFARSESAAVPMQPVEPTVTSAATADSRAIKSTSSLGKSVSSGASNQAVEPVVPSAAIADQPSSNPTATTMPENTVSQPYGQQANLADTKPSQADFQSQLPNAISNDSQPSSDAAKDVSVAQPMPEKLETSAAYLTAPAPTSPVPAASSNQADSAVAQNLEQITPGRSTRGGSSYIGIGGNLGLGGNPALGDGSFVVNSKIGLTRNISFRPAAVIGDDTDFLLPVSYDFVIESADPFAPVPFAPFVGGGLIVSTNGDNDIGFLLTGGVDVPLSRQFVANASINVGFRDDTDVGLILGVGYTFPGFSR